jgi:hypothetical protein
LARIVVGCAAEPLVPIRRARRRFTVMLLPSKLWHDVEQFRYLQQPSIRTTRPAPVARLRARAGARAAIDPNAHPLSRTRARSARFHASSRADTPRGAPPAWHPAESSAYLRCGRSVVDNFLDAAGAGGVRRFCLNHRLVQNRYAHGRLGAFFHEGFNRRCCSRSRRSCARDPRVIRTPTAAPALGIQNASPLAGRHHPPTSR